jgi:hypothetical protein
MPATRYNPKPLTVLNIVSGLVCILHRPVVLLFSILLITTLSITRERERGTMENLLAMPVRPIEVMIAKIPPYVAIGYVRSASSSPATRPSASRFRRSRKTRCRRCRWRVHFAALPVVVRVHVPVPRHAGLGPIRRLDLPEDAYFSDRPRILLKGNAPPRSRRSCGRSPPLPSRRRRSRCGATARPWIERVSVRAAAFRRRAPSAIMRRWMIS